jgi:ornithine carbamoyltransferase
VAGAAPELRPGRPGWDAPPHSGSGATRWRGTPTLLALMDARPRHFLTGAELSAGELDALLGRAIELKGAPLASDVLAGRSVGLVFQKPSTRTRVSFEVGIEELGGHAVVLRADEMQLSRGESPRDTALVLSRHLAAICMRTGPDELLEELAEHASVPVVNMLTALHHPCQALADLMTVRETFGTLAGLRLAYVGDGTNVARSLAVLGSLAGMHVAVASPPGYGLDDHLELPQAATGSLTLPENATGPHALSDGATRSHTTLPQGATGSLTLHEDPREAVAGAQVVYTDVWVSMGDERTAEERRAALAPYRLDDALLDAAAPDAIALHCLPAHPGEEISSEVLYGPRQRIWDQAENRRHAQKALLELLLA